MQNGFILGASLLLIVGFFALFFSKNAEAKPSGIVSNTTKVEQNILDNKEEIKIENQNVVNKVSIPKQEVMQVKQPKKISGFINTSEEINVSEKIGKGKVVLVSIWTYGCANCLRTLPHLNSWYGKYHEKGFDIISVHTPEFAFERKQENIEKFAKENGIKYPIIMDNDYSIWNSFNNRYWPHKWLFDRNGNLILDVIGEGQYNEMEEKIKESLVL